jgi:hypothetical protein
MQIRETIWPAVIFLTTWYALTNYSALEVWAYPGALVLWLVGVLAHRMASRAVFRLGERAWWLLVQLALWYGLFLFLAPIEGFGNALILWGIATPLVLASAVVRRLRERFPHALDPAVERRWLLFLLGACLLAAALWRPLGFWHGSAVAAISAVLALIPLYYGWELAGDPPRGDRDARFGTEDSFRAAGMSDER